MFENVDGRRKDGRRTDDGVIGILIAHLGAFGSGELKTEGQREDMCHFIAYSVTEFDTVLRCLIFWRFWFIPPTPQNKKYPPKLSVL